MTWRQRKKKEDAEIKTELCLKMKGVWFTKCSECRTKPVLCAPTMGSNPRAFPIGPVAPSCGSARGERRRREDGQSVPFSATSCWSDAPAWPSHESLHSQVVFVHSERHAGKFAIRQPGDNWLVCLVTPQSQWGIHQETQTQWMSFSLMNKMSHNATENTQSTERGRENPQCRMLVQQLWPNDKISRYKSKVSFTYFCWYLWSCLQILLLQFQLSTARYFTWGKVLVQLLVLRPEYIENFVFLCWIKNRTEWG